MEHIHKITDKIMSALAFVHNSKEPVSPNPNWHAGVMRKIHEHVQLQPQERLLDGFEQFVWRLSPGVCFLILMAVGLIWMTEFNLENEIAALLFEDPLGLGT